MEAHRALNRPSPAARHDPHPDVFFQLREAVNPFVDALPGIVRKHGQNQRHHRQDYKFFNYYGHPEADRLIVVMGSGASVVEETIDELMRRGERSAWSTCACTAPSCRKAAGSRPRLREAHRRARPHQGARRLRPLCLDVRNAYASSRCPAIYAGRYGLASRTSPRPGPAVFDNLAVEQPRDNFTVGIIDDVTHTSSK
ncbi:MAG: hypothetical protein ACLUPV_07065 [Bilophila wadsworthia]